MPPSRRQPDGAQPPRRRPRVAGLRKPVDSPATSGPEQPDPEKQPDRTVADDHSTPTEQPETQTVAEPVEEAEPVEAGERGGGPGSPGTVEPADETEQPEEGESQSVLSADADDAGIDTDQSVGADRVRPRRKGRDAGRLKPVTESDMSSGGGAVSGRSGEKHASGGVAQQETDHVSAPDSSSDAGAEAGSGVSGREDTRPPIFRTYTLTAVLVVLALAFSGVAVVFKIQHSEANAVTSNTAQVDVATTGEVKEAVGEGVERLFSLDYNDLEKTQEAADELLDNDEVKQTYDRLMDQVRELAPEQQMTVTTRVARSAVTLLDGDRAKVMVYVDQVATRADSNESAPGSSSMWVTAQRRDDEWKITEMDTYQDRDEEPEAGESGPEGLENEDSESESESESDEADEGDEDSEPEDENDNADSGN